MSRSIPYSLEYRQNKDGSRSWKYKDETEWKTFSFPDPDPNEMEYNLQRLLKENYKARIDRAIAYIESPFFTADECLAILRDDEKDEAAK